ncbi:MAG TPA: phosphate ABC transporter permease subunit PstC, partial [Acidimicrobiaceae bacterium]|nr:phosphate ABC transporter permease subunit PstC [Acidimicrobiaceae bacterium]
MSDLTTPATYTLEDLRGSRKRMRTEHLVRAVLFLAALLSIVISVLIVASLVGEAWTFVSQVEAASLWSDGWFPRRGIYDIKTLLTGTLIVTVIAMAVAMPLGLGAAIYLSEYAPAGVRKLLKPVLEILAGIPSVVLG